jgi:hypothetical protein
MAEWDRWNPVIDLVLFLARSGFLQEKPVLGVQRQIRGAGSAVDHIVDRHPKIFLVMVLPSGVLCNCKSHSIFKTVLRKWCTNSVKMSAWSRTLRRSIGMPGFGADLPLPG